MPRRLDPRSDSAVSGPEGRLDNAKLTAREIADQLGHAKPSMAQDVYMGRKWAY